MAEQREMSGILFREKDRKHDRAPEYTGKCLINGQELRIAAWVKEGRNGSKFMSLAFQEPRQQQQEDSGDDASSFF